MEKFIYYNNLYLIYKDLIKESNAMIFDLYYGENLSMQEIADLKGITRSRVGMIIKNVEKKLDDYEKFLQIYKKNQELSDLLELDNLKEIKIKIAKLLKGE